MNFLKMLGGMLLIVLALVLMAITIPPAFIWKVVASFTQEKRKARDILEGTKDFFVDIAISFDQTGCVAFKGFFTWLFLTPEATHFFGEYDETVSFVLGWNQRQGTLSPIGKVLADILDRLDPDHCQKALDGLLKRSRTRVAEYDRVFQ